jgi:putative addiction module killer protein
MIEVRKTQVFEAWLESLRDQQARLRILVRIDRLAFGNPGQHRALAGGICELKIDHGPGYRVYYTRHGGAWVVLLCGGNKASQRTDIKAARALAHELEN